MSTFVGSIQLYWDPSNDIDQVNDRYVRSLDRDDLLIGFEDIQSDFRIKLEAAERGFTYLNYFNVGDRGADARFRAALSSVLAPDAQVHVSPRLSHPPESVLVFRQSVDPDFEARRAGLLTTLRAIPGVHWQRPAVSSTQHSPGAER